MRINEAMEMVKNIERLKADDALPNDHEVWADLVLTLRNEVESLSKRNSDLSWEISPDRMGQ